MAHSALASALLGMLHAHLRGGPCRAHGSDLRLWVQDFSVGTYADVTVVCGPVVTHPESPHPRHQPPHPRGSAQSELRTIRPGTKAYLLPEHRDAGGIRSRRSGPGDDRSLPPHRSHVDTRSVLCGRNRSPFFRRLLTARPVVVRRGGSSSVAETTAFRNASGASSRSAFASLRRTQAHHPSGLGERAHAAVVQGTLLRIQIDPDDPCVLRARVEREPTPKAWLRRRSDG